MLQPGGHHSPCCMHFPSYDIWSVHAAVHVLTGRESWPTGGPLSTESPLQVATGLVRNHRSSDRCRIDATGALPRAGCVERSTLFLLRLYRYCFFSDWYSPFTICFTICLCISPDLDGICFTICLFISPDLDG
jgi:hypothetical protein